MNVYEATQKRIEFLFKEFENVLVSFSGGKDSSVMLYMCYDYAKSHNLLHKLSMVHMDYEAQYQMTTDYVEETFRQFPDIGRYWLCVPIHAQCACRVDGADWIPWEAAKKDIWCRPMPNYDYVINEKTMEFKILDTDNEVPKDFTNWFIANHGRTVSLVGIRSQESYSRQKLIRAMNGNIKKYKNKKYIVDNVSNELQYTAYPIYDWETKDIWIYNAKFGKPYNKLYDLFYRAGLTIDKMRVASPFNNAGIGTLKLYKVIDPNNWAKMIGRVNGVNMAGLYGGTTAMAWETITKPPHLTWEKYCYFLLGTLDAKTREHYSSKLEFCKKTWSMDKINTDAIYKQMCICIMKNDYDFKFMQLNKLTQEHEKRKAIISRYQGL